MTPVDQEEINLCSLTRLVANARHPRLPCQGVQNTRLTDVGAADEGDGGNALGENVITPSNTFYKFRGFYVHPATIANGLCGADNRDYFTDPLN